MVLTWEAADPLIPRDEAVQDLLLLLSYAFLGHDDRRTYPGSLLSSCSDHTLKLSNSPLK